MRLAEVAMHFEKLARPERFELPTTWFEISAINLNRLFIKDVVWALIAPIAPQCSIMHSSILNFGRYSSLSNGRPT